MTKKITLLALLFMMGNSQAQIIYQDILSDVVFTTTDPPGEGDNLCPIDLNNDGTKEFDFRWDAWNAGPDNLIWFIHFYSQPAQSTTRQFITGSPTSMLKPLQWGDPITPAQTYTNGFDPMLSTTGNDNFRELGDRYIGFRATIAGTVYYGWVRVSVENLTTTVKDYAYTTNANGLNAGQMNLSVQEHALEDTALSPNPVRDAVVIENTFLTGTSFQYTLVDLTGKAIRKGTAVFGNPIELGDLASGNYWIKIAKEDQTLAKRMVKQ